MTVALQLANRVLEGEDPKNFIRRIAPRSNKLEVGEEIISGTGISRDIMSACLDRLKTLDAAKAADEMSDPDVAAYVTNGDETADFDPDWYCFEHLYDVMQKYCPPFTFFGAHEADGSVGCWPPDTMTIEELVDMGKLTYFKDQTHPGQINAVERGNFGYVPTEYVLIRTGDTLTLWDSQTFEVVWTY